MEGVVSADVEMAEEVSCGAFALVNVVARHIFLCISVKHDNNKLAA